MKSKKSLMKSLKNRMIFKRVTRIVKYVDMSLFDNKEITIEYLHELVSTGKIKLKKLIYEKDVSSTVHSLQNVMEFKELFEEMIEAIKEYNTNGKIIPININTKVPTRKKKK